MQKLGLSYLLIAINVHLIPQESLQQNQFRTNETQSFILFEISTEFSSQKIHTFTI